MSPEASLWSFISDASILVKIVLSILFCASITSWAIIIQKMIFFKRTLGSFNEFEKTFWSSTDLNKLYQQLNDSNHKSGLAAVFHDGFKEYRRANEIEASR